MIRTTQKTIFCSRVSVSRSIFALVNDQDMYYFGQQGRGYDSFGYIESDRRAIFGESYTTELDKSIAELVQDEASGDLYIAADHTNTILISYFRCRK